MYKKQEELKAEILNALAHPNRVRIVELLKHGVKCNCEIGPELGLEQSNLSKHMKILLQAGIVVSWKEGLRINYKVADEKVFEILKITGIIVKRGIREKVKILEMV